MIRRLAPLLLLLVGACGPEPVAPDGTRSVLTVHVGGDQAILDAPCSLAVTVQRGDRSVTAKLDILRWSDPAAIAGGLAVVLADSGVDGATSSETGNPRFADAKAAAEDLRLPYGWDLRAVRVDALDDDGEHERRSGHLEIYVDGTRVAEESTGSGER